MSLKTSNKYYKAKYYGVSIKDKTTRYAEDVLNEKFLVGKLEILSCKRHLEDIKKSKHKDFEYYFDYKEAEKTFNFFETLKFTDGEVSGQNIRLVPFQQFIIGSLYGWKHKKTNYRRFNKSYIQMARKNAKSLLNAGIAIKHTAFDRYPYAQGYCAATKKEQAKLVWKMCQKTINQSKDLKKRCKIYERDGNIKWLHNGGYILALGRDTSTIDGFNPHVGIIDEYHEHRTSEAVSQLEEGTMLQVNYLISIITTAGKNLSYPCKTEYDYAVRLLHGLIDNDNYFSYITQLDKEDVYDDSSLWCKANPLLNYVPQALENLKKLERQAKEKEEKDHVTFLTKNLNIWYEFKDGSYINLSKFKACESELTLEDMRGKGCFIGLDLSSGGDLTSFSLLFEIDNDEYFIHTHSFIPQLRLEEHEKSDKVPYKKWVRDGLITPTYGVSGFKTDYKYIIKELKRLKEDFSLKFLSLGYDPHNASGFLADLDEFAIDLIAIVQSARSLNQATEDFKLTVDDLKLKYNKNSSLLKWSISNAIVETNSFDEMKVNKKARKDRIDPVDAVIDAWKVMLETKNKPKSLEDRITSGDFSF